MDNWTISFFVCAAVLVAVALVLVRLAIVITEQNTLKIVKRFGKYIRVANPGWSLLIPIIESTSPQIFTKVNVASIMIDGIQTSDGAFPRVSMKIHYSIFDPIKASRLTNLEQQVDTLVKNAARPHIARRDLKAVYTEPADMAKDVKEELGDKMYSYGLTIDDVLVETPDITPALRDSMQNVIISDRNLAAARNNAEATSIGILAIAKGEADGKVELGRGIAEQQKLIAQGFKEALENMKEPGLEVEAALQFLTAMSSFQRDERIAQIQSGMPNAVLIGATPSSVHSALPGTATNGSIDDIGRMAPIMAAMLKIADQQAAARQSRPDVPGDQAAISP